MDGQPGMAERAPKPVSLDEFLSWNDGTDRRYELIAGEIVAMNPPAEAHGLLVGNAVGELRNRLKKPCQVRVEAGIVRRDLTDTYLQADLAVSCRPAVVGDRWVHEPVVIVEVLSPSTAEHDRGTKLPAYRAIPTVQEIVLIDSETRHAELWQRTAAGWSVSDLTAEATIALPSVDVELPMGELYDGVPLAS
jgi:Uma2 family endonuclease